MSVLALAMLQATADPSMMAQVSDYDFACRIYRDRGAIERLDARVSGGQFVLDAKGEMIFRAAGAYKGQPEQTRRFVSFSNDGTSERVGRWNGVTNQSYAASEMSDKTIGMYSSQDADKLTKEREWVSPHNTGSGNTPDPTEYQFRFEINSDGPNALTIAKFDGAVRRLYGVGFCETKEIPHPSVKIPAGHSIIMTEAIQ